MAEIQAPSIANLAGTGPIDLEYQAAAKTLLQYDQTSGPTINASLNISSVTDDSTGNYDPNYTTSMANTEYFIYWTHGGLTGQPDVTSRISLNNLSVGSCKVDTWDAGASNYIDVGNYFGVFGDLA